MRSNNVWVVMMVLGASAAACAQCPPRWADWFAGGDVFAPASNRAINASVVWERDGESLLCLGGGLHLAGGLRQDGFACWNGRQWIETNSKNGVREIDDVFAMIVHDDGQGGGPQVYLGGSFYVHSGGPNFGVVRWDGTHWEGVGSLTQRVYTFEIYDDGTGPKLYAGGQFSPLRSVAAWDGTAWQGLGTGINLGVNGTVYDLAVHDPGTGPVLVIGGQFNRLMVDEINLVTWNGQSFAALGPPRGAVEALATIPAGEPGAGLYAAGRFLHIGPFGTPGTPADGFVRFDENGWTVIPADWSGAVDSMTYVPPGEAVDSGLYIAGAFRRVQGQLREYLVRYDPIGGGFSELGDGISPNNTQRVSTVALYGEGEARALYAGGTFMEVAGVAARSIAAWNGESWRRVGNGAAYIPPASPFVGFNDPLVCSFVVWDDGTGPALYAGGSFAGIGASDGNSLARWDGADWHAVAGDVGGAFGVSGGIRAMVPGPLLNDPSNALYLVGRIASANETLHRTVRWDGVSITPLGEGLDAESVGSVFCAEEFEGRLYVGGMFETTGGQPTLNIAAWDGAAWSAVGEGFNAGVHDLVVYDDGSGAALYACGSFSMSGDQAVNGIARLGKNGWAPLGEGLEDALPDRVYAVGAIEVYDDGAGPALYALGTFGRAGGEPVIAFARWNGSEWAEVDTSITDLEWTAQTPLQVTMGVYDDGGGKGPQLYLGAPLAFNFGFRSALSRWNGESIEAVDVEGEFGTFIYALAAHDDGRHGETLFIGGRFTRLGGVGAGGVTQLLPCNPCPRPCDWNHDQAITSQDFFEFLTAFFGENADYNHDGQTNTQDFFDFLACFFVGC